MILSCRIGFSMPVNQTFGISYLPFRVVMVAFAMMMVAFFANGGSTQGRLPGLIVVCFGQFWVRGLPFPNARHQGHPFQWKNTLPWHLGPAAKFRILRFKNLPPFRHDPDLQNHV
jgi:hypothetical protein